MKFQDLRIGVRLAGAFGITLALSTAILVAVGWSMGGINDRTRLLVEQDYKLVEQGTRALDNTRGSIGRVFQLVGDPDPQRAKQGQERLAVNLKAVGDALAEADRLPSSPKLREVLDRAKAARAKYEASINKVRRTMDGGEAPEALAIAYGETYPALHELAKELRSLIDEADNALDAAAAATDRAYRFSRNAMLGVGLLALAAGAALAWAIARSITRPLQDAVGLADRIATGDLSASVATGRRDELGQLLQSLARMRDGLADIVAQVRQSSESIVTGTAQIASGNADLSQRTESQASSLEETAASMEQLTATVRQSADTASAATTLAAEAATGAGAGGEAMQQVVNTMRAIGDSSRRIAEIISVIDGIAFQTNILALNAAVEAARAGEQGRGFAVVASEVRALAGRSAEAAREIRSLIAASSETVDEGTRLVDDAGHRIGAIVEQVRRVNGLIGELGQASREQRSGIEQIGSAVESIDRTTQQNAALVEQSAAAAESLRRQAEQLTSMVARFRLSA